MVSTLIVGVNTWRTLAESDLYMEDSIRGATRWKAFASVDRSRALLSAFRTMEKQLWKNERTGVRIAATAVIAVGGTGYARGDVLSASGGTFGAPVRIEVLTEAAGVISSIELLDSGTYDVEPGNPVSTTGGGGSGATLTLTFKDQEADFPRVNLKCDGADVPDNVVPEQIGDGQIELAFDYIVKPSLEAAADTGSNIRKAKAGSAEVEFFRATNKPGENTRFPAIVDELLSCFKGGGVTAGRATGTDGCSDFDTADTYRLNEGYA